MCKKNQTYQYFIYLKTCLKVIINWMPFCWKLFVFGCLIWVQCQKPTFHQNVIFLHCIASDCLVFACNICLCLPHLQCAHEAGLENCQAILSKNFVGVWPEDSLTVLPYQPITKHSVYHHWMYKINFCFYNNSNNNILLFYIILLTIYPQ